MQIFGKKWQKLDFICSLWCFLGILGDQKGRNTNIFLKYGCKVGAGLGAGGAFRACFHRAHLVQVVQGAGLPVSCGVCSVALSALSLCACRVACKYGSISRFYGVFGGFLLLGVGLYCLRALRGL